MIFVALQIGIPEPQLVEDRITSLGSGVDGTVLRIARSYEVRGLLEKIASYDDATVGSGNVVNKVQMAYNGFQQLVTEYQECRIVFINQRVHQYMRERTNAVFGKDHDILTGPTSAQVEKGDILIFSCLGRPKHVL